MKNYFILLPSLYFVKTRLNTIKAFLFHSYSEWLAAVLILFYLEGFDFAESLKLFLLGYLSFISMYEIGYICNDTISVNIENKPRRRGIQFTTSMLILAVAIRLLTFISITYHFGFNTNASWLIGYFLLAASFFLHNYIKNTDYRLFTFVCLSLFRFFLPFYLFTKQETLDQILPSVLLGYVFFRALIYMDSKDQLRTGIRSSQHSFFFYLLILPAVLFIGQLKETMVPIISYAYFIPLPFARFMLAKRYRFKN